MIAYKCLFTQISFCFFGGREGYKTDNINEPLNCQITYSAEFKEAAVKISHSHSTLNTGVDFSQTVYSTKDNPEREKNTFVKPFVENTTVCSF